MGRPKKAAMMHMLQANDQPPEISTVELEMLSEQQIRDALENYLENGMRLTLDETHWFLTLKKNIRTVEGKIVGSGDVTATGVRSMPVKDLVYSARELMIPITPVTPNSIKV